jgi:hypothetical protein
MRALSDDPNGGSVLWVDTDARGESANADGDIAASDTSEQAATMPTRRPTRRKQT